MDAICLAVQCFSICDELFNNDTNIKKILASVVGEKENSVKAALMCE